MKAIWRESRAGRWRVALAAVGVLSAALVFAPGAMALKLGSLAPRGTSSGETCDSCHGFQANTAAGSPSYAVPAGRWKITSWRSRNTTGSQVVARLQVFRPTPTEDRYKLVAQSRKTHIPAHSAPSQAVQISVRPGDLIGLATFSDMVFSYESPPLADRTSSPSCTPAVNQAVGAGTTCPIFGEGLSRVNVSVHIQARRH